MTRCVTELKIDMLYEILYFEPFVLVLSYYRDRVVSIYSHTVFARRINVQVGTVSVTSLFASLFFDCYHQPIITPCSQQVPLYPALQLHPSLRGVPPF